MPQYATPQLASALLALWDACFPGEGDTYCKLYFSQYFDPHHCCVILDDAGLPLSALYWFDGLLSTAAAPLPVALLYAGCTRPEARGQGNLFRIMAFIAEHCRKQGIYAMFANTKPSSRGSCERLGMRPAFYLQETEWQGGAPSPLSFAPCPFPRFAALRQAAIDTVPYSICWTGKELRYMYADLLDSGAVLETELNGQHYYAAVTWQENGLLIRESSVPLPFWQQMVNGVCQSLNYRGPVRLQTRDGAVPPGATHTRKIYCAHLQAVLPHPALECLLAGRAAPLPYCNLTAN